MSLQNRYLPSKPGYDTLLYGYDFSPILPPGVVLTAASLDILENTVPPRDQADMVAGAGRVAGRRCYATASGGLAGHDYRLGWTVVDSQGTTWSRVALLMVGDTS